MESPKLYIKTPIFPHFFHLHSPQPNWLFILFPNKSHIHIIFRKKNINTNFKVQILYLNFHPIFSLFRFPNFFLFGNFLFFTRIFFSQIFRFFFFFFFFFFLLKKTQNLKPNSKLEVLQFFFIYFLCIKFLCFVLKIIFFF